MDESTFESTGEFASRLDFAALLDDNERLLKVRTALPALALLPEHLVMREAVSAPFELVLDCVSTSAQFGLKQVIGEQMTVSLKRPDGDYSPWHGYVKQAGQLGSDGGWARYRLTMGSWLDMLALRRDSFVFQDKTALEIVEAVFADYPSAQWRLAVSWETRRAMRKRSLCIQYRESDLAFVSRLLAQEGLHYWFEHLSDDDGARADAQGRARHMMVIADDWVQRTDLGPIRFAAQHPTAFLPGLEDPITLIMAQRVMTANAAAVGSWDYTTLKGAWATVRSSLDLGEVPTLEAYEGSGAYRFQDRAAAEHAARLALSAAELPAKGFHGIGAARGLRPGARFSLIDHPSYGANTSAFNYAGALTASHDRPDNAFTVLSVEHEASNNLGSEAARLLGRGTIEKGTYKNSFECVLAAVPVVPPRLAAPTAPAELSARVVGIEKATVFSERGHRVKVQMHFQRGESPNPGNGPHRFGRDAKGNAPGDQRSGTWVRVAGPAAGANWGSVYTPRIGSEVSVQFIEGDIDRPIIVGGLHGGTDAMPLTAGVDSGVNHPGVVSGLHSQRLDAGGFSQFALDDAPGQLRTRLHTSHAGTELGLGHLVRHSPYSAQRGAWRGTGFEANTKGWASARGGRGLLVSSSAKPGGPGSAPSTQMDTRGGVAQLKAARDLGHRLSQVASAVRALGLATHRDGRAVPKLVEAIDPKQDGKHPDSVNGQSAMQPGTDDRNAGDRPVHAYAQPVVVFDTPSALLAASSAGVAAFAGQAISVLAQQDLQQSAAHTMTQTSGATTSVYAHQGGIAAVAANGPVSLRAHTDGLSILADKSITVTSVDDEIRIEANEQIQFVAGQAAITLKGGDIDLTMPGAFSVHGAMHLFEAAGGDAAQVPALPAGALGEVPHEIELVRHYEDLSPVSGAPYKVSFEGGSVLQGTLDSGGRALLTGVPDESYTVQFAEDPRTLTGPPSYAVPADFMSADVQARGKTDLAAWSAGHVYKK